MDSIFNDLCCSGSGSGGSGGGGGGGSNVSSQWSNVGASNDIYIVSSVAIGSSNPYGNTLSVTGNLYATNAIIGNLTCQNIVYSNIEYENINYENISYSNLVYANVIYANIIYAPVISNLQSNVTLLYSNISNIYNNLGKSQWTNVSGTNNIFISSGNVAIGTSTISTGNTLTVSGNTSLQGTVYLLGNLIASNVVSNFTGNVIGSTNVFGNIAVSGFYFGDGSQLTGIGNVNSVQSNLNTANTLIYSNISNIYSNITATQPLIADLRSNVTLLYSNIKQWTNVTGTTNIYTFANVAIGTSTISTGNVLTVLGNVNTIGNLIASNVFTNLTGNVIGSTNVFGNITANFFVGDGSRLTGITGGTSQWINVTSTTDVRLASGNVAIGTSTISTGNTLTVSGNVSSSGFYYGDGSTLSNLRSIGGAISDETTTLTTSNYTNVRSPFAFNLTRLPLFWLNVLPTAVSNTVFDIQKNGVSIYSTKPQISSISTSNVSAATNTVQGVLAGGSTSVALYDLLTVRVDTVGSGTPAGAKFVIYC